jgi:hypothetical protein
MHKQDFANRRSFPGTHDNSFDVLLRLLDAIQNLPAPVFAAALFALAVLPTRAQWPHTFLLWAFMLGDWALLAALPRFGKSFGPAKPPAMALAILRLPFALLPPLAAVLLQMTGTALVVYGFWIEPHRVRLTRQTLRSAKLNSGPPLRVLHLGDLHIERITGRERQLIDLVKTLDVDLILFSGDFLNLSYLRDPAAWEAVRWVMGQLSAPRGVFAVTGSPAVDLPDVVPQLLDGLPLRWLHDERVTVAHNGHAVDIVGLNCTHKPFVDGPRLVSVLEQDREGLRDLRGLESFTILLYHTPDLAPEAAEAGIDLQLSGHTHGGQVRLPLYGALITASLYGKAVEAGRRRIGGMTLYVTRGIGMEGKGAPRVRFLCPPEIILWELSG